MLPGFTPRLFPAVVSGGNDSFTKLLLHGEGTNGAAGPIIDSSLSAKGNATIAGTITLSSGQKKFGSTSIANNALGYFTFPSDADWNFGSSDFTIDWWEYRLSYGCVMARDVSTTWCPFIIGMFASSTGGIAQIYMTSTGSSWDIASGKSLGAVGGGAVWDHCAVVRSGINFYAFKNGAITDTWSSSAAIVTNSNPLCFGAAQNGNNFNGYLDELRISKGIARWTAAFTPPTAPYS